MWWYSNYNHFLLLLGYWSEWHTSEIFSQLNLPQNQVSSLASHFSSNSFCLRSEDLFIWDHFEIVCLTLQGQYLWYRSHSEPTCWCFSSYTKQLILLWILLWRHSSKSKWEWKPDHNSTVSHYPSVKTTEWRISANRRRQTDSFDKKDT